MKIGDTVGISNESLLQLDKSAFGEVSEQGWERYQQQKKENERIMLHASLAQQGLPIILQNITTPEGMQKLKTSLSDVNSPDYAMLHAAFDYLAKSDDFRNDFIKSVGTTGTKYDKLSLDELEKKYNDAKDEYEKYFGKDDKFGIGEKLIGSIRYASDTSSPDSGGSSRGLFRGVLDYATGNAGDPQSELSDYLAEVSAAYHKRKEAESTFDDIIKSKDYSRFSDYLSGDKTVDYEKIAKQINDETYRNGNFLDAIGAGFYSGMVQTDKAATSVLDMTIGNVAKAFGWKNNPVSKLNEWVGDEQKKAQINAAKASADIGDKYNILTTVSGGVAIALPTAIIAYATGGGSAAAMLNPSTTSTVSTFVSSAVKNPLYWTSFASEVGLNYEKAKASGANEFVAYGASILESAINAFIEVGGGIETLPGELKGTYGAGSKALKWAESALEEGGEEVLQDFVSSLTAKAFYDQDAKWFSTTDENAVINPKRGIKEGFFGAAVGGLMGGGQLTIDTIVNANTSNELKHIGQIVKNTGLETDTINFAKQANTEQLSAMVREYQTNKSTELLGAMYQRLSVFVNDEINNVPTLTESIDNFDKIVNNTKNKALVGSASSQIITRMIDAGMDSESSQYMEEQIRNNANKTEQAETFEGVQNAPFEGVENQGVTEQAEQFEGVENQPAEVVEGAEETVKYLPEAKSTKNIPQENRQFVEMASEGIVEPDLTDLSQRKPIIQLAHDLGYKIRFQNNIRNKSGGISNGYIDRKNKVIVLNPNVKKPITWTLKHELSHSIEQSKSYKKFVEQIEKSKVFRNWLIEKTGLSDGATDEQLRTKYKEMVQNARPKEALGFIEKRNETVADFVGDVMFSGDSDRISELLNSLGSEKQSFIDIVKDFFAKLKNIFTADGRRLNEINRLEKAFLKAANEEINNPATVDGVSAKDEISFSTMNDISSESQTVKQKTDAEYLRLAENPEENRAELKKMVADAAYDSGLRFVGLHGTPYFGFTRFEKGKSQKLSKSYKSDAFFFTNKYRVAETYSNVKGATPISQKQSSGNYLVALDVKNPLTVECNKSFWNDIPFEGKKVSTDYIVDYAKKNGYDGVVFNNLIDSANLTDSFREEIRKSDELKDKWSSQVVAVFDSNQIKSLDPVTYDDNGDIIPLSERFDKSKDDIRYSTDTEQSNETENEQTEPTFEEIINQYERGEISRKEFLKRMREEWVQRGKEFGTIPEGENASADYAVPKAVDKSGRLTRRFIRTILEKGNLTEKQAEALGTEVLLGKHSYEPTSNKADMKYANKVIKSGEGEERWNAALRSPMIGSKTIAIGEQLLADAAKANDTLRVLELSAQVADVLTRAGQTVQAGRMLKKMTGVGRLVTLQRFVQTLNENNQVRYGEDFPVIKVDENLASDLANSKTTEEIETVADEIMQNVADQTNPTWLDKWNAWRYTSMLANIITHVRNVVGNAIFIPTVRVSDSISALMEQSLAEEKRTKSFIVKKEYMDFAKADGKSDDVQALLKGEQKYLESNANALRDKQRIFKTEWLEKLRRGTFGALEWEDMIFKNIHYQRALAGYLQARKADLKNVDPQVLDEARAYAVEKANKYTYNDASAMANFLSQMTKINSKDTAIVKALKFGADGILPFKRTPINIIRRGIEYSPIGLLKTLTYGAYEVKSGKITASEFIDGLSSGLTGGAVFALGMLLTSFGIVSAGFDDDKEDKFKKLNGEQQYSINILGKSYTVDWAVPACIPFFIGAETMKAFSDSQDFSLSNVTEPMWNSLEPIINLSMLSGLQNTLDASKYAKQSQRLSATAESIALNYAMQGVPSSFGALSRTIDPTQRSWYTDKNAPLDGFAQDILNNLESKIPGISYLQSAKVDEWGRVVSRGGTVERIAENFFSPGKFSNVQYDDVNREIKELGERTGESSVYPSSPQKSIKVGDKTKYLSAKEYEKYSIAKGELSFDYVEEFINSDQYDDLSDEQKIKVIENLYKYANAKAKSEVSDYDYEKEYKTLSRIEKNGGSVVDYYIRKSK